MSLEIGFGKRLIRRLLHCLSTQLEHDKDDHLVMIMMMIMMLLMMMIKMMIMMLLMMMIKMMMMMVMMMNQTRQKPTTLAKVPRNIAKIIRRSRVVPTYMLSNTEICTD